MTINQTRKNAIKNFIEMYLKKKQNKQYKIKNNGPL